MAVFPLPFIGGLRNIFFINDEIEPTRAIFNDFFANPNKNINLRSL